MKNHSLGNKLLVFSDVTFSYVKEKPLINTINIHIENEGEIVCLLGASGSGKSTIIKLATKEIEPLNGIVDITSSHLIIFQDFERMILPWFNVLKNITYGLANYEDETLQEIASFLEIKNLLESFPNELSGGEKQRVIFARALLRKPNILIFDEPLSSIDIGLSKRLIPKIKSFLKSNKISSLWITHDLNEAIIVSDKILVINGKGKITQLNNKNIDKKELIFSIQDNIS